jgi:uncharacterized membrane protein
MNAEKRLGRSVSILLAAIFVVAGTTRFASIAEMGDNLGPWSSAMLVQLLTGFVELSSAIMLVLPRSAMIGAIALASLMTGSFVGVLIHGQRLEGTILLLIFSLLAAAICPAHSSSESHRFPRPAGD